MSVRGLRDRQLYMAYESVTPVSSSYKICYSGRFGSFCCPYVQLPDVIDIPFKNASICSNGRLQHPRQSPSFCCLKSLGVSYTKLKKQGSNSLRKGKGTFVHVNVIKVYIWLRYIAQLILNLCPRVGEWKIWGTGRLTPEETISTHWIGHWVGPRAMNQRSVGLCPHSAAYVIVFRFKAASRGGGLKRAVKWQLRTAVRA